ncbi:MAG: hypothetical protein LBB34_02815 [Holosporales bacterium]|jgi:hypothetical protein|nr:hypothetical protein [Holosporales bacterium]
MFKRLISKEYLWGTYRNPKFILWQLTKSFAILIVTPKVLINTENDMFLIPIFIFWFCRVFLWGNFRPKSTITLLITCTDRTLDKVVTTEYLMRFGMFFLSVLVFGLFGGYSIDYLLGILVGAVFVLTSNLYFVCGSAVVQFFSECHSVFVPLMAFLGNLPHQAVRESLIISEFVVFLFCMYVVTKGINSFRVMESLQKGATLEIDE